MTVLEPAADDSGRWVVYYSERGHMNDPRYFATEDEACDFVYARLTAPPPVRRVLTAAEEARAAELGLEAEQRRRELVRAAGYDPDTRQPLR